MACTQPVRAWQHPGGGPIKWREPLVRPEGTKHFKVPCGRCLSCRLTRGREWAIRCSLELKEHSSACWCTLTYSDENLPTTLQPSDLQAFLKRLRINHARSADNSSKIRFFACGEYGDRNGRPHYHAILYGLNDPKTVEKSWGLGRCSTDPLSPAAIAYVAGYCTKKAKQQRFFRRNETVDPETGEVLYIYPDGSQHSEPYQEPFLRMSLRPGIGNVARNKFRDSWRESAIHHGREVPAPRTFRDYWKQTATPEELAARTREVEAAVAALPIDHLDRLKAAARIAIARHYSQSEKRKL